VTGDSVASLLAASFAALAAELPAAHARMCARLSGRAVALHVGEERLLVTFAEGRGEVRSLPAGEDPGVDVRIATSHRAILDVLDARRSLAEAVLADEVLVVGDLAHLAEAQEGLVAYVHGGVRCPSFPGLVERFRRLGG
jgi:hypothetical protein